ncbi:MAG: hypothetical protein Tsb0027_01940 [Wenzhouxiangellaceae bacterium]
MVCEQTRADLLSNDCDSINALTALSPPLDDLDPAAAIDFACAPTPAQQTRSTTEACSPPLRDGPRRHLLFLKFNE